MLTTLIDAFSPFTPGYLSDPSADRSQTGWFHHRDGSLRYRLFVPACYDGSPMPLIVMLHGGGQDARDFAIGTGMNALAEEFGCLVVYPEQSSTANWTRCWNWFHEAHRQAGSGEPALIAGITEKIMADYAVDPSRVYAAGLSSGGAMAVILGQTYPELFCAIGCHSGLAFGSATDHYGAMLAMRNGPGPADPADRLVPHPVPSIVFHGDEDMTVHPRNAENVVQQSITHARMKARDESGEMAGRRYTRIVHQGADGAVAAEQWTVHGTGHAWSGGNKLGSYTDAAGPNASREMLRFFLQHRNSRARVPHATC